MGSTSTLQRPTRRDAVWRNVPLVLALVAIVAAGIVQGIWSDRWGDAGADAALLAPLLDRLPITIQDWQSKPQEVDERQMKGAGAVGHLARVYRNVRTGDEVSLVIICGHMRNVCVHTPDRCYPAAGFEQLGEPMHAKIEAKGEQAKLFTTTFQKTGPDGIQQVRVYWTWGHDGRWDAPDWPREAYGGVRAMYKLYLIASVAAEQARGGKSPALDFGRALLPALNPALFPTEDATSAPPAPSLPAQS